MASVVNLNRDIRPQLTQIEATLERLHHNQLVAVIRADDPEAAFWIAQCLIEAGLKTLEITWTIPQAADVVRYVKAFAPETVTIGAGTLTNEAQVEAALEAGATFTASPFAFQSFMSLSHRAGALALPGVMTPKEVYQAVSWGAQVLKVFPAGSLGGASYIKNLLGPFPDLKLVPFGGIRPEDITHCLKAGAFAVGLGSQLLPTSEELTARDQEQYLARLNVLLSKLI